MAAVTCRRSSTVGTDEATDLCKCATAASGIALEFARGSPAGRLVNASRIANSASRSNSVMGSGAKSDCKLDSALCAYLECGDCTFSQHREACHFHGARYRNAALEGGSDAIPALQWPKAVARMGSGRERETPATLTRRAAGPARRHWFSWRGRGFAHRRLSAACIRLNVRRRGGEVPEGRRPDRGWHAREQARFRRDAAPRR